MVERTASPVRKKPQRLTATAELPPEGSDSADVNECGRRHPRWAAQSDYASPKPRSVRQRRVGQAKQKIPMALPCLAQSGRRDMIVQWCSSSSLATRIRHRIPTCFAPEADQAVACPQCDPLGHCTRRQLGPCFFALVCFASASERHTLFLSTFVAR